MRPGDGELGRGGWGDITRSWYDRGRLAVSEGCLKRIDEDATRQTKNRQGGKRTLAQNRTHYAARRGVVGGAFRRTSVNPPASYVIAQTGFRAGIHSGGDASNRRVERSKWSSSISRMSPSRQPPRQRHEALRPRPRTAQVAQGEVPHRRAAVALVQARPRAGLRLRQAHRSRRPLRRSHRGAVPRSRRVVPRRSR